MFKKVGSLGNFGGPILVDRIVANSVTVSVGGAVKTLAGFAALVATGDKVLGVVEQVIGSNRLAVSTGSTYRGNFGDTFAAAADNQTVAMNRVRVDVSPHSLYQVAGDAALGTTTGSNLAGKTFDLANSLLVDESTVNITSQQVYSHGPSEGVTTELVVNIFESEVFGV